MREFIPEKSPYTGRRGWIGLGAVVVLALGLRLYRIDWQSVWHDEIFTLYACGRSPSEMLAIVVSDYNNPPLHYLLLFGWLDLFGYGVLQGRLLSTVFGVMAVLFTALLGRELFGRRTGVLAGLLLAVSMLGVMFSQEARCYSQLLGFTMAAIYFFVLALRRRSVVFWSAFVLCAVAAVYTHYYGIFTVLVLAAFALVYRHDYRIPFSWWIGGASAGLLLFVPWVLSGAVEMMLQGRKFVVSGEEPSVVAKWSSLLSTINWFNNGKWFGMDSPTPIWLLALGAVLFTLPAAWGSRTIARIGAGAAAKRDARWPLLVNSLWFVPLALILAASFVVGVKFNYRYTCFLVAPYLLVVAKGLSEIKPRLLSFVWIGLVVADSAIGLRAVYFLPYKPDYRSSVNVVAAQRQPGDCSVFLPERPWGETPKAWYVYHPGEPPPELRVADGTNWDNGCARVWVVWDRTWWLNEDTEPSERAIANVEQSYVLDRREQFFGSEARLYIRKTSINP